MKERMMKDRMMKTWEQRVREITKDSERLQYDGKDFERIREAVDPFVESTIDLIPVLSDIGKELDNITADEGSADRMKSLRILAVNHWANLQLTVSKLALVLRIDGEEAIGRRTNAIQNSIAADFSDL